jgi:hypothetical protein
MGMTWEPMKPAPPVMKTVDMELLPEVSVVS